MVKKNLRKAMIMKKKKVLPNVLLSGALMTPPKKFPNTKILTETFI